MTRIEYELLRQQHPGLRLIHWLQMGQAWRNAILHWSVEDFVTQAVAHQLTHETPYFGIQGHRPGTSFLNDAG